MEDLLNRFKEILENAILRLSKDIIESIVFMKIMSRLLYKTSE